jgi:hypothetical protein
MIPREADSKTVFITRSVRDSWRSNPNAAALHDALRAMRLEVFGTTAVIEAGAELDTSTDPAAPISSQSMPMPLVVEAIPIVESD